MTLSFCFLSPWVPNWLLEKTQWIIIKNQAIKYNNQLSNEKYSDILLYESVLNSYWFQKHIYCFATTYYTGMSPKWNNVFTFGKFWFFFSIYDLHLFHHIAVFCNQDRIFDRIFFLDDLKEILMFDVFKIFLSYFSDVS